MGAVAWRKMAGIWRKARGFLGISLLLGCFLLVAIKFLFGDALLVANSLQVTEQDLVLSGNIGACALALLGTLYLANGLRFDFREDLEQLETLRSWPIPAWKLFVASLLPQVIAIASVLSLLLLIWLSIASAATGLVFGLIVALPPVVFAWVAVDNIAFLLWPVRFVPGQAGQLQHIGRGLLLSLARITFFLVTFGLSLGAAAGVSWLLLTYSDLSEAVLLTCGAGVGLCVLLVADGGLALLGAVAFKSYDPARDRV